MKNLYLDASTKDLVIENNNLKLTSNVAEFVSQKIENKLLFLKGEWYLNYTLGVPYFEEEGLSKNMLGKNPNINYIKSIFLKEINSIPEVSKINFLTLEYDNTTRTLSVDFSVTAQEVVVAGTLNI